MLGCGIAHLPAVVREAQTIGAVSDGAMVGGDGRKQAILKFACKALISRRAFAHHFEHKFCRINAARRAHAPQQKASLFDHLVGQAVKAARRDRAFWRLG